MKNIIIVCMVLSLTIGVTAFAQRVMYASSDEGFATTSPEIMAYLMKFVRNKDSVGLSQATEKFRNEIINFPRGTKAFFVKVIRSPGPEIDHFTLIRFEGDPKIYTTLGVCFR